jgi:probable rRNA maturation factor
VRKPESGRRDSRNTRHSVFRTPHFIELSVALVDDVTIAIINRQFLNHVGPTDVISFDLGDGLGEVIVSAERAVVVARRLRRPPTDELALYLVHGLLHLAGLDDRTPAQRHAMRHAERRVLRAAKHLLASQKHGNMTPSG